MLVNLNTKLKVELSASLCHLHFNVKIFSIGAKSFSRHCICIDFYVLYDSCICLEIVGMLEATQEPVPSVRMTQVRAIAQTVFDASTCYYFREEVWKAQVLA